MLGTGRCTHRLTAITYPDSTSELFEYSASGKTGQRMYLTEEGEVDPIWSVPSNGRDEVPRLLVVEDANADASEMSYDIDGRCTQIDHNNSLRTC